MGGETFKDEKRHSIDFCACQGRWVSEVREGGVSVRFVVQGFYTEQEMH
jgi:hypothetical protein